MAEDKVKATEGLRIDRRLAAADEPEVDHLTYLDEEIADAEQRLADAKQHLDQLKQQKRSRS